MKKQILFFFLFVVIANVLLAQKTDDRIIQLVKKGKTEVLSSFNIMLTDTEVIEITRMELEKDGVSVESFSDAIKCTRQLIKALSQVIDGKNSKQVYQDLNLKGQGITEDNWSYYVKNYQTKEKIQKLEETIPDTNEKLIYQLSNQYRQMIENYLLHEVIIMDFDSSNPTMKSLDFREKISSWWKTRLTKYDLSEKEKETVLRYLSWPPFIPREEKKDWSKYFKLKLDKIRKDSMASGRSAEKLNQ
jgi:hypothetical protein